MKPTGSIAALKDCAADHARSGIKERHTKAYIGTSGWNYKSWRDDFYGDTPQRAWVRFCAERFTGIEVNRTFYKLAEKSTSKKWSDATPEDFPFAIKGHRYVTHNKNCSTWKNL
jgi:uncharacterized protein YecE (DUF72 family)